jgi:hypothetical protein
MPSIEREQDGVQQPDRREIEAEPVGDERHIAEHPDDAQRDHLLHPESHEHHAGGEIADRIPMTHCVSSSVHRWTATIERMCKAIEPRVIELRRRDAEPVFEPLRHEVIKRSRIFAIHRRSRPTRRASRSCASCSPPLIRAMPNGWDVSVSLERVGDARLAADDRARPLAAGPLHHPPMR